MSTYGSLAITGLNVLLFIVTLLLIEPWRRRRLVQNVEERCVCQRERILQVFPDRLRSSGYEQIRSKGTTRRRRSSRLCSTSFSRRRPASMLSLPRQLLSPLRRHPPLRPSPSPRPSLPCSTRPRPKHSPPLRLPRRTETPLVRRRHTLTAASSSRLWRRSKGARCGRRAQQARSAASPSPRWSLSSDARLSPLHRMHRRNAVAVAVAAAPRGERRGENSSAVPRAARRRRWIRDQVRTLLIGALFVV